MKILTEMKNRKIIDQDVMEIINRHLDSDLIKEYSADGSKTNRRKLDRGLEKLCENLAQYIKTKDFGLYGKSKVLKTTQDYLLSQNMDDDFVEAFSKKIILR